MSTPYDPTQQHTTAPQTSANISAHPGLMAPMQPRPRTSPAPLILAIIAVVLFVMADFTFRVIWALPFLYSDAYELIPTLDTADMVLKLVLGLSATIFGVLATRLGGRRALIAAGCAGIGLIVLYSGCAGLIMSLVRGIAFGAF